MARFPMTMIEASHTLVYFPFLPHRKINFIKLNVLHYLLVPSGDFNWVTTSSLRKVRPENVTLFYLSECYLRYVSPKVDKRSIILSTESTKIFLCVVLTLLSTSRSPLREWSFIRSFKSSFIPAMILIVQNMLFQYGNCHLDNVTFSLMMQSKTLSAAVLLYLFLGVKQSRKQVYALFLLSTAGKYIFIA